MKKEIVSICCNAPVTIQGKGDFDDDDEVGTFYNECLLCHKPCDIRKIKKDERPI